VIAVVAASIAALAALIGYWATYRTRRIDSKTEIYAKALAAVTAYKQLPYRIRRRAKGDDDTRDKLGQLSSDVHQEITYYRHLLNLDSRLVASAYEDLIRKVYQKGKGYRDAAWEHPPISADNEMSFVESYNFGEKKEMWDCINAMRQELGRSPIRAQYKSEDAVTDGDDPANSMESGKSDLAKLESKLPESRLRAIPARRISRATKPLRDVYHVTQALAPSSRSQVAARAASAATYVACGRLSVGVC
jgi:hypothetical protein